MPPHSNFETSCIEWRNHTQIASNNESSNSSFDVLTLPSSTTTLPPLTTDENDTNTWNDDDEVQKTKKSVRFSEVVRCKKIRHHNDISSDQKRKIWFGKDDLRAIKRNCRDIVEKIESGVDPDPDPSTRGLDHWSRAQQIKRRFFRTQACREVLFMQELQHDLFYLYHDQGDISKLIAVRYSTFAAEAQTEAQFRALEAAYDVKI
jgi:hypothetical protein